MSNYPIFLDDDSSLLAVNDNLTEIGGEAINQIRDAILNIEQYVGTNPSGVSIESRLGLLVSQNGTINSSVFTSLGLVTLPITNTQIIDNAGIPESKLHLDYRTQDLFNYIRDLSRSTNTALNWIDVSGIKLEPHLVGLIYRHTLSQIDVASVASQFLDNKFRTLRDNDNSYTLINDLNNELLSHQWNDGSPFGTIQNVITNNGSSYPSNYGHTASGIYLNTSRFFTIPQTNNDLQQFADYIDGASIFLLGTRIQNLYTNGISKVSRSSSLLIDGYGQAVVSITPATTYLNNNGTSSSPVDDIATGDDIVQFNPTNINAFTAQFALVKIGDIVRVNYGNIEVAYVIKEKRYIQTTNNFVVRIDGKNLAYTTTATARIDRSLVNSNKYGVLATAAVPITGISGGLPSLIIASPRGAQALGIGFNPDQFDSTHYALYLSLYPTGNPQDGYTTLPAIDMTGNAGATPGAYTLEGIVSSTNNAFRQAGYNYRFIAYSYQGNLGVMLADSYNNASFSIISAAVVQSGGSAGNYDPVATSVLFPNNVVGIFPSNLTGTFTVNNNSIAVTASNSQTAAIPTNSQISFSSQPGTVYTVATVAGTAITLTSIYTGNNASTATAYLPNNSTPVDPLGFGLFGAGIASPPFITTYASPFAAQNPTKLFVPLSRNNYYVNGVELERLNLDVGQVLDTYGDGYWVGTVHNISVGLNNLQKTYRVFLDLSTSKLKIGKTLVVQTIGQGGTIIDFGRFTISNIDFEDCNTIPYTDITVYDAVHANGSSPASTTAAIGTEVAIYFNSDTVSFNKENASDFTAISPNPTFKRHFEVFIDENSSTFTNERGRFNIGSTNPLMINAGIPLWNDTNLVNMDLVDISPKLRGYQFGSVSKITLNILSFNSSTGIFTGYLCSWDGNIGDPFTHQGLLTTGKIGEIVRFYDETNIDYIDVSFPFSSSYITFSNKQLDIQLFPTLSLDQQELFLAVCQVNDVSGNISYILDRRQFGNTSEKDLTTSALDLISLADKLLHVNGVVRGFDLETLTPNPNNGQIYMTGGLALVDGEFIQINNQTVIIPLVQEVYSSTSYNINWILCANSQGDYQPIPLLDFDPVLNTPNNPTRIVQLINVNNLQTYSVDATTFSDLINNRKDLTPLYFVSSTIIPPAGNIPATITLTVQDARRFINDQDANIVPTLTTGNSQGNFKTFNSALHWLVFNSAFQNTIQVKGAFTVPNDLGLLNQSYNIINAGTNSSLSFASTMVMSNVQFTGLTLNFAGSLTATNVIFNNCAVNIVGSFTATNVIFNNCQVIATGSALINNLTLNTGSLSISGTVAGANINNATLSFGVMTINAANITNSTVNFSNIATLGRNTTFNNSILTITNNLTVSAISLTNCTAQVSTVIAFTIIGSQVEFIDTAFTYTANPIGVGAYDTTDLVNASMGMIYSNLNGFNLSNLTIRDCSFTNTLQDHPPFVSIQLASYFSYASTIDISNNQFISQAPSDDIRAVIAFTSSSPSSPSYPKLPRITDVIIDHNLCNNDQMILVSIIRSAGNPITGALINTTNTSISNNVCGAIGFLTGAGDTASFNNSISPGSSLPSGLVRDKLDYLVIEKNTCKLIANLDHRGDFIPFYTSTTNWVRVATGNIDISNNSVSWISLGNYSVSITDPTSSNATHVSSFITNNNVFPNDKNYLTNYTDSVFGNSGLAPYDIGISLLNDGNTISLNQTVISGNTISQKQFSNLSGGAVNYYYSVCALSAAGNAQITNNIIDHVINDPTQLTPIVILGLQGGTSAAATNINVNMVNNTLNRGGLPIYAYILGSGSSTGIGNITNNIFDSPTTGGVSNTENLATFMPFNWNYTANKNQTAFLAVNKSAYLADIIGTQPINNDNNGGQDLVIYAATNDVANNAVPTMYEGLLLYFHTPGYVNPPFATANIHINANAILPPNVQILNIVVGVGMVGLAPFYNSGSSSFVLSARSNIDNGNTIQFPQLTTPPYTSLISTAANSLANYISDAGTSSTSFLTKKLTGITDATLQTTQYLVLDTSPTPIAPYYVTFPTNKISIMWSVSLTLNANNGDIINVVESPLMIRYRW